MLHRKSLISKIFDIDYQRLSNRIESIKLLMVKKTNIFIILLHINFVMSTFLILR